MLHLINSIDPFHISFIIQLNEFCKLLPALTEPCLISLVTKQLRAHRKCVASFDLLHCETVPALILMIHGGEYPYLFLLMRVSKVTLVFSWLFRAFILFKPK
jgi:hypothetical protein